jgi:hypothetical protein
VSRIDSTILGITLCLLGVVIMVVPFDPSVAEKKLAAANKAKVQMLQLIVSENDFYSWNCRWEPRTDVIFRDERMDTSFYRFSVDTCRFVVTAVRRDGGHDQYAPGKMAVNRAGLFIAVSSGVYTQK